MSSRRGRIGDARVIGVILASVLEMVLLLGLAGCATCDPRIIREPVPVPEPYPVVVVPELPPAPVCVDADPCAADATDREQARCAVRNVTRLQACRAAWVAWYADVAVALEEARETRHAAPE